MNTHAEFVDHIATLKRRLHAEIEKSVIGLGDAIDLLLVALLARGHALLEGVPGIAKTLLARSFAAALGAEFQRIQFTPDLLPTDVTGGTVFDRRTSEFVLRKGPVFTQMLLADEINRSPAKTQSALLEAMQERQVTIDGKSIPLPDPFIVLATQNPVEEEGVYRLPEAQLDRFLVRVRFPYPSLEDEMRILRTHARTTALAAAVTTVDDVRRHQAAMEELPIGDGVLKTASELARETRQHPAILLGLSPRASLCLVVAARVHAALDGRTYVIHEDMRALLDPVLSHRLILKPEAEMDGLQPLAILEEVFGSLDLWEVR